MPFVMNKNRKIYILFTRSNTLLSRTIHLATGDEFTHVSIAFDEDLSSLCSFARRYSALPLPAGLVQERINGGYMQSHGDMSCMLCSLDVSEQAYWAAREMAGDMLSHSRDYRYSLRGLAMCRLGIPEERPQRFFCSQFVAELLQSSGALELPKPASLMRPQDLAQLSLLHCLYRGEIAGLGHSSGYSAWDSMPGLHTAACRAQ